MLGGIYLLVTWRIIQALADGDLFILAMTVPEAIAPSDGDALPIEGSVSLTEATGTATAYPRRQPLSPSEGDAEPIEVLVFFTEATGTATAPPTIPPSDGDATFIEVVVSLTEATGEAIAPPATPPSDGDAASIEVTIALTEATGEAVVPPSVDGNATPIEISIALTQADVAGIVLDPITVEVDWHSNGYAGYGVDVTNLLQSAMFSRGRKLASPLFGEVTAGSLAVTIWDSTNEYSDNKGSGGLDGLVTPNKKIRYIVGNTTKWQGTIRNIVPALAPGGIRYVTFECEGILTKLVRPEIEVPVQQDIITRDAMEEVLSAANVSPLAASPFTPAVYRTLPYWWATFDDALAHARAVEAAEGGLLIEDGNGDLAFQEHTYRLLNSRDNQACVW